MMHLNFRKYLLIAVICGSVGYGLRSQQESQSQPRLQSLTESQSSSQSQEGLTDTASSTVNSSQCMNPSAPKSVGVLLTEFTSPSKE